MTIVNDILDFFRKRTASVSPEVIPTRIHICWIGPITQRLGGDLPLIEIISSGILDLTKENLFRVPRDLGGLFSILETLIKYKTSGIELYFHCLSEYKTQYQAVINEFCELMKQKYKSFMRSSEFSIVCYVISFQESLAFQDNLMTQKLKRYLDFILDPRVKNIRHRVNFRDVFNFYLLFIYGGYTLDANIIALEEHNLFFLQRRHLEKLKTEKKIKHLCDLKYMPQVFLLQRLEPVLVKYSDERGSTIRTVPRFFSKNKDTLLFDTISDDYYTRSRDIYPFKKYVVDYTYDIYAMRSLKDTTTLPQLIDYSIQGFRDSALRYYTPHTPSKNKMIKGYLGECMSIVISAPLFAEFNLDPRSTGQTDVILKRRHIEDEEFMSYQIVGPDRKNTRLSYFTTLPLLKISSASYKPVEKPEEDPTFISEFKAECEAVHSHLTRL